MFVGCFVVLGVANFGYAVYPPIGDVLWRRLTGEKIALKKKSAVPKKCIVPKVFKRLVARMQVVPPEWGWSFLTRLGHGEKFKPERCGLIDDAGTFDIARQLRNFYHTDSEEDVSFGSIDDDGNGDNDSEGTRADTDDASEGTSLETSRFDAETSRFDADEYRKEEIERCEKIFQSEEFWEGVLGKGLFKAFAESCNEKAGRPSACLRIDACSCLLKEYKQSETYREFGGWELSDKEIAEAVDRIGYTLCLSQWHYEKIDEHTGKSVKVSEKDVESENDKKITDFELTLFLIVDMATEEIEEVKVLDKITVNGTYRYFPDGVVVFGKE